MAEKAKKKPNALKNILGKIVRFFKDTKGEMKKVVWPSKKQVINNSLIVLGFVVVCAILIVGLDALFACLFQLLVKLGSQATAPV